MSKIKILLFTVAFINFSTRAQAYQVKSIENNDYILVQNSPETNLYEIMYCKQIFEECIHLGNKKAYSLDELSKLKKSEYINTAVTGVSAAAIIVVAAFIGGVAGGIWGMTSAVEAATINTAAGVGSITGVSISATGISFMDSINPIKHYQNAKMLSKITASKVKIDYTVDVFAQAMWLDSILTTLSYNQDILITPDPTESVLPVAP